MKVKSIPAVSTWSDTVDLEDFFCCTAAEGAASTSSTFFTSESTSNLNNHMRKKYASYHLVLSLANSDAQNASCHSGRTLNTATTE